MGHKIVLVEDHPMMQKGMEMTLQTEPDFEVAGMVSTAEEAFGLIEETRPDIAVVDISLPGMNGIELIRHLRSGYPDLRILVVSRHEEELFAERAVRAGAQGYIMKLHAGEQIVDAVRRIANGGLYLSEAVSQKLLMGISSASDNKNASPLERLTDRELEIFRLIGRGKPAKEIAKRLNISPKTVDTYKSRISEKLNIPDRASLLQQAMHFVNEKEL
ncbi:response regulator transcription factor [Natronogracilivirga saccharolytica]|uniref:Response regulator transcription factor n=1 Tax=Natronogracilivirga saccharolytica TaxID=2812953 RepID=A0A8J7RLD0_9BACT|nr:response regulator transcription factor [Natronogracilivirga saccharolytica]MBP3191809.1 response regulator transcription factor [Natronogracilivirga saccharolytica]